MVISELIKALRKHKREHGDLLVITARFSDYEPMGEGTVVDATRVGGQNWLIRYHPTMPDGTSVVKCLYFDEN